MEAFDAYHVVLQNDTMQNGSTVTHLSTTESVMTIVLVVLNALTVGGNILVLLSILVNRKLRTVTNSFLFSLATADLTLGLFVLPFSTYLQIKDRWIFGEAFCNTWAAVDVLCCTASIYSLCAISIDRYIGVTRPIHHRVSVPRRRHLSP